MASSETNMRESVLGTGGREGGQGESDELVGVGRVLVIVPGHGHEPAGSDCSEHVLDVEPLGEAGNHLGHLNAGSVEDLPPVRPDRTASAAEPHPLVDCHEEQRRVASVGMTDGPDRVASDIWPGQKGRHGRHRVFQNPCHQRLPADQAIGHGVVVLIPVVGAGVGARTPRPAILEGHRVRGEHDEPGPGQRRRKGLERVADDSEHLRLAEVTLARMLMKGDNAGERTITGGDGDERRDGVAVDHQVDSLPGEAVFRVGRHQVETRNCRIPFYTEERPELTPKPPSILKTHHAILASESRTCCEFAVASPAPDRRLRARCPVLPSSVNMAAVPTPAGDRVMEATAAAARVAALMGAETTAPEVLHQSNNVVIRFADVVLKVSTDFALAERDVVVASHVSATGGPALAPLLAPTVDGDFSISAWPYLPEGLEITARDAGEALRDLHQTLVGVPINLPPLSSRFDQVAAVLADSQATCALDPRDRAVLQSAVDTVAPTTTGADVLHTEPHDRNRLRRDGQVVYIDLEAASVGPVEWDLAYLPDDVVQDLWPDHDALLRATLTIGVSACVSIACWRHVTARPHDADMRWHAEHHLDAVRTALA